MEKTNNLRLLKTLDSKKNIIFGGYKENKLIVFDSSVQNGYRDANDYEIQYNWIEIEFKNIQKNRIDRLMWLKTNIVLYKIKVDLNKLNNINEINIDSVLEEIYKDVFKNARINKTMISNVHEESSFTIKLIKDDIRWYFPIIWTKEWIIEKLMTNNSKKYWLM